MPYIGRTLFPPTLELFQVFVKNIRILKRFEFNICFNDGSTPKIKKLSWSSSVFHCHFLSVLKNFLQRSPPGQNIHNYTFPNTYETFSSEFFLKCFPLLLSKSGFINDAYRVLDREINSWERWMALGESQPDGSV